MTEDEAKTKRCHKDMRDNCVGSVCMAWRWQWASDYNPNMLISMQIDPKHRQTFRADPKYRQTSLGYCGLAGRPEDRQ